FDVKVAQSTITLRDDDVGFARTAAGFWNTTLSPFQAANVATTMANGGEMIRLSLVAAVKDEAGEIYRGATTCQVLRRAVPANVASDMLRVYFADKGAPGVTDPRDHADSKR